MQPNGNHGADAIQWRDLLPLDRMNVLRELTLSLPWLLLSWLAADRAAWVLALAASFMFFLTGLRQVHNAFHAALGLPPRQTRWVMAVLSALMLGSMHAVRINHLRHHRHCLQAEDIEAMSARLRWWQALAIGPVFPVRLHLKAWEVGSARDRRWMAGELGLNLAMLALAATPGAPAWLRYHLAAMLVAQCLTAFFAVWTVHHDCEHVPGASRTVRGRLKARMTYNMFFHAEHHRFPAVPTCRLHILAARIDAAEPLHRTPHVF